jgi:hypothetical protein
MTCNDIITCFLGKAGQGTVCECLHASQLNCVALFFAFEIDSASLKRVLEEKKAKRKLCFFFSYHRSFIKEEALELEKNRLHSIRGRPTRVGFVKFCRGSERGFLKQIKTHPRAKHVLMRNIRAEEDLRRVNGVTKKKSVSNETTS